MEACHYKSPKRYIDFSFWVWERNSIKIRMYQN